MSGLDRLLDAVLHCSKCGTAGPPGSCACWERCSCGHWTEPGWPCHNATTRHCSSKLRFVRQHWTGREWQRIVRAAGRDEALALIVAEDACRRGVTDVATLCDVAAQAWAQRPAATLTPPGTSPRP